LLSETELYLDSRSVYGVGRLLQLCHIMFIILCCSVILNWKFYVVLYIMLCYIMLLYCIILIILCWYVHYFDSLCCYVLLWWYFMLLYYIMLIIYIVMYVLEHWKGKLWLYVTWIIPNYTNKSNVYTVLFINYNVSFNDFYYNYLKRFL